jgi:hypothetical protein
MRKRMEFRAPRFTKSLGAVMWTSRLGCRVTCPRALHVHGQSHCAVISESRYFQQLGASLAAQSLSGGVQQHVGRVKSASTLAREEATISDDSHNRYVSTSLKYRRSSASGIPEVFATPTPPRYLPHIFSRGACCGCTCTPDHAQRAFCTKQQVSAAPAISDSA